LIGPTLTTALAAARRRGGWSARRTGAGALAAAALGAVALSGCGGSSSAATSSTSNITAQKSRAAFTSCMQQHGVDIRSQAGPNGGGVQVRIDRNTPAFQKAFTACRSYLRGAFGNITPAQQAQFRQALVKFTACLRQHGQNVPDPTFGGDGAPGGGPPTGARPGGGARGVFAGIDRNSPAFQAAAKACQSNLPKPPGGGGFRFGVGPGGPGGPPGGGPGG
jgi:hypothetical protein